jgi:hypothetical protein
VNFANQLVGAPSPPVAINATNTGTGALVISSISFSGANPTDFLEKDTCQLPIAPAAMCTINVTFKPTTVGARSVSIILADNAPNSPQSLPLTGAAMNFAIDPPNIGAISATITAGQTATYQLALQSIDGFAGPATLTCTGAPPESTCTVTPNPVTLTANATAPFQVQVTTTARPRSANLVIPPVAALPPITTLPIFLVVLFVPIAIAAALLIMPPALVASPQALQASRLSSARQRIVSLQALFLASRLSPAPRQARQHKPTAHRPTTSQQKFAYHVSPQIAIAATLEIALLLSILSCGSKTQPSPQSGTPANTYTVTLSASTPGGPPPTTQFLALTIQ